MSLTCRGPLKHLSCVMCLFENGSVVILVDDGDHEYGWSIDKVPSQVCGGNFQLCGWKHKLTIVHIEDDPL